jgi:hypothetical protein
MARQSRSHPGQGSAPSPYPGTFLLAFREAAGAMKWQVRRWLGHAVQCLDENGREQVVGLENLFRRIRPEVRDRWPALIAEFLSTVSAAETETLLPSDLASAAEQLLVRLGPPFHPEPTDAKIWSRAIANTGLGINLVVDHPSRMCYVTEKLVNDSGRTAEDWLEVALENLYARTPADSIQVLDEESGVRMCTVGDAYDSSRVLLLDRLVPESSANGFFVAVPSRDQLFILPVTREGMKSVHLVKIVAEKNYRGAPYPISAELFWIRHGAWHPFGVQVRGREATVSPPPEFNEVLACLFPEGDGERA